MDKHNRSLKTHYRPIGSNIEIMHNKQRRTEFPEVPKIKTLIFCLLYVKYTSLFENCVLLNLNDLHNFNPLYY